MKQAMKLAAGAALIGLGAIATSGLGASAERPAEATMMNPGQGLSLDVGGKHVVSYFEPKSELCSLTVVMADALGGATGTDSPGTRIIVPVAPGKALRIDAAERSQSAEFFCGPAGRKMAARIFERQPYKGAGL